MDKHFLFISLQSFNLPNWCKILSINSRMHTGIHAIYVKLCLWHLSKSHHESPAHQLEIFKLSLSSSWSCRATMESRSNLPLTTKGLMWFLKDLNLQRWRQFISKNLLLEVLHLLNKHSDTKRQPNKLHQPTKEFGDSLAAKVLSHRIAAIPPSPSSTQQIPCKFEDDIPWLCSSDDNYLYVYICVHSIWTKYMHTDIHLHDLVYVLYVYTFCFFRDTAFLLEHPTRETTGTHPASPSCNTMSTTKP